MKFCTSDLLLSSIEESVSNNIELKNMTNYDYGHSYFDEAVDFVKEAEQCMDNAKRIYYRGLLESNGNTIAVTESFSDFIGTIKDIIDKFLKFIKKLFDKFILMLNNLVKSESYLKKHKDDFNKFSAEHEFDFKGYRFTFKPGVPVLNVVGNVTDATDSISNYLGDAKDAEPDYNTAYSRSVDGLETYYDSKRAAILGRPESQAIFETDFADELFREFRDDYDTPTIITATSSVITAAYQDFENYKSTERKITKEKKDIESKYKAIKDEINRIPSRSVDASKKVIVTYKAGDQDKTVDSTDGINAVELLFKLEADKIQKLSDMHALAFSAKLTALKDCYNQDKVILYKALQKMNKFGAKKESVFIYYDDSNNSYKCNHRKIDCNDELVDFDDEEDIINLPDMDDYDVPGIDDDYDDIVIHDDEVEESLLFDDEDALSLLIDDSIGGDL